MPHCLHLSHPLGHCFLFLMHLISLTFFTCTHKTFFHSTLSHTPFSLSTSFCLWPCAFPWFSHTNSSLITPASLWHFCTHLTFLHALSPFCTLKLIIPAISFPIFSLSSDVLHTHTLYHVPLGWHGVLCACIHLSPLSQHVSSISRITRALCQNIY